MRKALINPLCLDSISNHPNDSVTSVTFELLSEITSFRKDFPPVTTYFQPIYNLHTGEILGYEVFTRPENGEDITKVISRTIREGILSEFDLYCRLMAIIRAWLLGYRGETLLFLNVHPKSLSVPNYPKGVTQELLSLLGLPTNRIVIEITEYEQPDDYEAYLKTIFHFISQGFQISLDDFGAGCLSFKTLFEVNPNFVKIDKFFVKSLTFDGHIRKIVKHFSEISEDLAITTIAEGIEDRDTLNDTVALGVKYGQGYLLCKPQKSLSKKNITTRVTNT